MKKQDQTERAMTIRGDVYPAIYFHVGIGTLLKIVLKLYYQSIVRNLFGRNEDSFLNNNYT